MFRQPSSTTLRHWLTRQLELTRLRLARPDALLQLALMGLLTGVLAGLVIVAFRLGVEYTQNQLLSDQGPDAYEILPWWARFGLPVLGAILLALMFRWFAKGLYVLGVARALERMAYHQGRLTWRGFFLQLAGVAIAIISGHSVGREGAHIFLGSATGSLLGQRLDLPNNALRALVGCGAAAGIAASFNTPLAGVIFALEVIMLDYQLASFIPVIISAVSATVISNLALGNAAVFSVPPMGLTSLLEIPLVIFLGLLCGAVAAAFIQLVKLVSLGARHWRIEWQMLAAGAATGVLGMGMGEIMGIGYDTINATLLDDYMWWLLLLMALLKLLATSICSGLNVPGGMIGPAFFIGATLGGGLGHVLQMVFPGMELQPGFYAMLGMGALMAASLQAPLAALTALLELTDNPEVIMPGMLVVVIASLTARELFHQESLVITLLKAKGLDYHQTPVMHALLRVGVASMMERSFVRAPARISLEQARALLAENKKWIILEVEREPQALLPSVDLLNYLEHQEHMNETIDLSEIPANRLQLAPILLNQTLLEARETLDQNQAEALYVRRMNAPGIWHIYGVITRDQIRAAYSF